MVMCVHTHILTRAFLVLEGKRRKSKIDKGTAVTRSDDFGARALCATRNASNKKLSSAATGGYTTARTAIQLTDRVTDGKPNGSTTINSSARFAKFPDLTMMASRHTVNPSTSVCEEDDCLLQGIRKKESRTINQGECFRTLISLPSPHL